MDLYSFAKNEEMKRSISYLVSDRKKLAEHTADFLKRLSVVCTEKSIKDYWGTAIEVQGDGTAAELVSPLGTAKMQLDLRIVEYKVEGNITIRKDTVDDFGRTASKPIASIRVTKEGIFLGESQEYAMLDLMRVRGEDKEAHAIVGALLYAIGTS